ncbi:hypothetical protein BKA82DRAFT_4021233 [Pisolithus tinctorius]|nr:hypothetical protein BKA82DRAFT_4021233 [Pisolithus tinctorius]
MATPHHGHPSHVLKWTANQSCHYCFLVNDIPVQVIMLQWAEGPNRPGRPGRPSQTGGNGHVIISPRPPLDSVAIQDGHRRRGTVWPSKTAIAGGGYCGHVIISPRPPLHSMAVLDGQMHYGRDGHMTQYPCTVWPSKTARYTSLYHSIVQEYYYYFMNAITGQSGPKHVGPGQRNAHATHSYTGHCGPRAAVRDGQTHTVTLGSVVQRGHPGRPDTRKYARDPKKEIHSCALYARLGVQDSQMHTCHKPLDNYIHSKTGHCGPREGVLDARTHTGHNEIGQSGPRDGRPGRPDAHGIVTLGMVAHNRPSWTASCITGVVVM